MTEQEKREKVIAEIERIADEANPWKESPPLRCDIPYPLLIDAIALLKAQELRVLSLDEAVSVDECWFEHINGACGYASCVIWFDGGVAVERIGKDEEEVVLPDEYGITWRCWSLCPDDERRQNTPWGN